MLQKYALECFFFTMVQYIYHKVLSQSSNMNTTNLLCALALIVAFQFILQKQLYKPCAYLLREKSMKSKHAHGNGHLHHLAEVAN